MTAVFILSFLILAAALLPLVPLRLEAAYKDGAFTLTGRAGWAPVTLYPRRRNVRPPGEEEGPEKDKRKRIRRIPPPVLRLAAECGCRAAGRLARHVRIFALQARYTAAGPDPAKAVMAYARAGIAMEGIAAAVDGADLRADVDLEADHAVLEGRIGITARLGTILAAVFCFGIAFLRRYYQYKREKE